MEWAKLARYAQLRRKTLKLGDPARTALGMILVGASRLAALEDQAAPVEEPAAEPETVEAAAEEAATERKWWDPRGWVGK